MYSELNLRSPATDSGIRNPARWFQSLTVQLGTATSAWPVSPSTVFCFVQPKRRTPDTALERRSGNPAIWSRLAGGLRTVDRHVGIHRYIAVVGPGPPQSLPNRTDKYPQRFDSLVLHRLVAWEGRMPTSRTSGIRDPSKYRAHAARWGHVGACEPADAHQTPPCRVFLVF